MSKSKTVTMTGYIEYANIFEENYDDNMDFHGETEGEFNANFYPETDDELSKLFEGTGFAREFRGRSRIKDPMSEKNPREGFGTGSYIVVKRPRVHPMYGQYGGQPEIVHFTEGRFNDPWSFNDDGELGNGTKVKVKLVVYGNGDRMGHRLIKVGVVEHVPYIKQDQDGDTEYAPVDADGF